jgi:hypothetical protein
MVPRTGVYIDPTAPTSLRHDAPLVLRTVGAGGAVATIGLADGAIALEVVASQPGVNDFVLIDRVDATAHLVGICCTPAGGASITGAAVPAPPEWTHG